MTLAPITPPKPATSYEEARARVEELQARDGEVCHPGAVTRLLGHGRPTERAVLLFHGISASPAQFADLGALLHEGGANVLIPRLPRHGLRNRLSPEFAGLRQQELLAFADEALDIVAGLGERVTVAGLSVGAALAGWCAQRRADVDRAVLIAPSFGLYGIPGVLTVPLARLVRWLPNWFAWWHPVQRACFGPEFVYPGVSSRAMAASFLLGAALIAEARRRRPLAREIVLVTNDTDRTVNNRVAAAVVRAWREHGAMVRTHQFRGQLPNLHDFISPYEYLHPYGPAAYVKTAYPVLVELIAG